MRLEMMEMAGEEGVKWTGRQLNEPSNETVGERFRCNDREKSRSSGKNGQGSGRGEEQQTGRTS